MQCRGQHARLGPQHGVERPPVVLTCGRFDHVDGDGTFVVGIRAGLTRDERLTLYGGADIVAGSDPAIEYGEVRSRFEPILHALEPDLP